MNMTNFCRNSKQESMTKDANTANMAQKYGLKISSYKGGPSWSFGSYGRNNYGDEDATPSGFPWPPRSYTCSFCKREFRSAQALGGHMNVHRRDRARLLRQYSPPPSETCGDCSNDNCNSSNGNVSSPNPNNVEPKPNPSLSSNPISYHTKSPTFAASLPVICPAISSQFKKRGVYNEGFKLITNDSIGTKAASKGHVEGKNFNASGHEKECEDRDVVRLDLEIGLTSDHHQYKGELDLELRLGYI